MKKILTILFPSVFAITFLHAQNVFKVQAGAVIKTTGGALITLQNMNLDNDGTISQTTGEGKFLFTGTADNSISGTGTILFDLLETGKTGAAKISLQRNIQVGSGIIFTSGLIDLNNNNILMLPAALLNGESETSHITGTAGGYIEITNALNTPSAANPGNLGAMITSAQNMGSTAIRRGHKSQTNGYGNGNTIYRYYDVIPTNNTFLNATLRLNYLDAELNGLNENFISLWKSTNNTSWTNEGFDTRNSSSNYVEKTGIAGFSRWTLSSPLNPLPLSWGSFNTQCINYSTKISWQTYRESNTRSFIIQQSSNGINWKDIATLLAAGNSTVTLNYTYTSQQLSGSLNYYRIIEQDIDGRKTYSPVLKNDCSGKEIFFVYPNPAQHNLWVNLQTEKSGTVSIQLYDSKGALVKQRMENIQAGNNLLGMQLNGVAPGIYSLLVRYSDGKIKVVKVEKQ
ncbi:MAG TPA: T9SS type A sorting domain-containing protein [Ferruginibacter sp.]|nr:T9SS type A sorting domain-containing protein [Ferruginibacter sp.]